jgi:hypothetical protein
MQANRDDGPGPSLRPRLIHLLQHLHRYGKAFSCREHLTERFA